MTPKGRKHDGVILRGAAAVFFGPVAGPRDCEAKNLSAVLFAAVGRAVAQGLNQWRTRDGGDLGDSI
jgi:hypothetical protein